MLHLQDVTLHLWDTAGQEGYNRIRILAYENTQCFVVCFSVVDEVTLSNVKSVWLRELRDNQPDARILLVGTKADLRRTAPENQNQAPPDPNAARIKEV
jgi:small GTP-binding protein